MACWNRVVAPGTIAFDHRLVGPRRDRRCGSPDLRERRSGRNRHRHWRRRNPVQGTREFARLRAAPFARAVAQRAIFPTERRRGFEIADCTKWWGPDRHILPYFMTSRRDEIYVIGVIPAAQWENEASSLPCSPARKCSNCSPASTLICAACWRSPTTSASGRSTTANGTTAGAAAVFVLLGDACHPMRPFMAAGGAMAVEDGVILSRCLERFDDHNEAFRWYEAARIPRVTEVQRI